MRKANQETMTLVVKRTFDAPAEMVFDAWLDETAVGQWLFATPDGVMERVEIDPRVGGKFMVAERRGDELAEHFGTYLEIDRPNRLVFTFSTDPNEEPSRVTVEIKQAENGCELTLTHEMHPKWAEFEDRITEGWTHILEGLATTLAAKR